MKMRLPFKIASDQGVFFIAVSQFGMAFSFHCMLAFLPFYVTQNSPFGPKETMLWIGMIMGASNVVASFTASFWGGLTSTFRPKLLFERGMLVNGTLILLMGFTGNLYLLLIFRLLQGAMGGVSTIGLILISSLSAEERLHKNMSLFQNSITAGQLMGPPVGAYAASLFGYRAPFVLAFVIVSIFIVFCHRNVRDIPPQQKELPSSAPLKRGVLFGWGLILMATVHVTFLPSILPKILEDFQLVERAAVRSAGFIIMSYTAAALAGNYLLSHLASKIGLRRVITLCSLFSAFFLVLLIVSGGVVSFALIRMVEVGCVAAVAPLTISLFARDAGGGMMGFLNSSRFVGSAVGAMMATSVVAYSNLLTLYLLIAVLTVGSLWGFLKTIPTGGGA